MRTLMMKLFKNERGAAAVEYVMIAGIIGLGIAVGAGTMKNNLNTAMTNIGTALVTNS